MNMLEGEREVYCFAGVSYCAIFPNGDLYRCTADYTFRNPPLFNVKDGWRTISTPLKCYNYKCEAWCDLEWNTKWIFEPGTTNPKIIKAKAENYSHFGNLIANQTMKNPIRDSIYILWHPTFRCNYSCKYCWCTVEKGHTLKNYLSATPELSVKDWVNIWQRIRNNYNGGIITTGGGEPLLSKATLPVIEMMADKFTITIVTNLSVNVMNILRANIKPRKGNFVIHASIHPSAKEFNRDLFFGSVLSLKNNGFSVIVNFVGYPLQLFLAEEYKEWCDKYDVGFAIIPWGGEYDNSGFKAKYTNPELEFINKVASQEKKPDNVLLINHYNYFIDCAIDDQINVEQGDKFSLTGQVKNIGNVAWHNCGLGEENSFKVGLRVIDYDEEGKVIAEYRSGLPQTDIFKGDSCQFKIDIDTHGLAQGVYLAKLDMLKENAFWFEDSGAEPLKLRLNILPSSFCSEVLEVILPEKIERRKGCDATVKIKNTGQKEWVYPKEGDFIRVGCKIFSEKEQYDKPALKEFRSDISASIKPGEVLVAEMHLDFKELENGEYVVIFDMVNENKFWFAEKGSKPHTANIALF